MSSPSRLFKPLRLGGCDLQHRIAMSPLTRFRADDDGVLGSFATEYYSQRSAVPGSFLVSEATAVSRDAVGFNNVPGIWDEKQLRAWAAVSDSVHAQGSFIFLQLWATGRSAEPDRIGSANFAHVSSSAISMEPGGRVPRAMTEQDILSYIELYAQAARNAVAAGMDGVEIHGANGYLIDQFIQSSCNQRLDKWGGSIENRARFALEVTKAVISAVGADRVGIKLSPWGKIQGMGSMKDLVNQFQYLVASLCDSGVAYLRLANSRWLDTFEQGIEDMETYVRLWDPSRPLVVEGGYDAITAREEVDVRFPDCNVVISFGRLYISNPDLPFRLKAGVDLTHYNRSTFYTPMRREGYIDYPFCAEFLAAKKPRSLADMC